MVGVGVVFAKSSSLVRLYVVDIGIKPRNPAEAEDRLGKTCIWCSGAFHCPIGYYTDMCYCISEPILKRFVAEVHCRESDLFNASYILPVHVKRRMGHALKSLSCPDRC